MTASARRRDRPWKPTAPAIRRIWTPERRSGSIRLAESKGFRPYTRGMTLKAGDKVYTSNRGKMLMLAVIGEKSLAEGVQIAAAHVDAPRLDLKPSQIGRAHV